MRLLPGHTGAQRVFRHAFAGALLLVFGFGVTTNAQTLEFAAVSAGASMASGDEVFIVGEASGAPTQAAAVVVASGTVPILFPPTFPGDLNCDGALDFFDIDPFLLALFDQVAYSAAFPACKIQNADVNGDGAIDFFDIDPFLLCLFGGCP